MNNSPIPPIPIQVHCYAGHKADERPLRFACEGTTIEIDEILDRWLAAGKDPEQPPADYFKIRGSDGHEYLLRHDHEPDVWFVVNRW